MVERPLIALFSPQWGIRRATSFAENINFSDRFHCPLEFDWTWDELGKYPLRSASDLSLGFLEKTFLGTAAETCSFHAPSLNLR
jgi:hypothetical protein